MAEKEDQQQQQEHQEPVLLLGLTKLGLALRYPKVLTKFKLLFPTSPLHQFLKTHAQSIRVLFCSIGNIRVPINSDLLDCVPCLKCIVVAGVGLDHIDVSECKRRGVSVANAGNVFTEDVADCAVALLLDVLRKVSASDRYVRSGAWPLMGDFPLGHKDCSTMKVLLRGTHKGGLSQFDNVKELQAPVSSSSAFLSASIPV